MSIGSGLFTRTAAKLAHLLTHGMSAEIADVRQDLAIEMGPLAALAVEEYVNPVAGTAAMLLAATASTVAVQTYAAAALLAPGKAALLASGRNVTFTTAGTTPADAPATVVVAGTGMDGKALSETVTIAQTATIATGVKIFKTITSITYAAGDGAGATISIGVGNLLGTTRLPKVRAGLANVVREVANGAAVTTGTFVAANRSYLPAAAPDGTKTYCLVYEFDATVQ